MASISRDKKGNRTIQVVCADGKRRSIRLGKMPKKAAETVKGYVEALNAAAMSRTAWDRETAEWVGGLEPVLHDKLAAVGLVPKRAEAGGVAMAVYLDNYIDSRTDMQPNTLRNLRNSRRRLVDHFGAETPIRSIRPGDADEWRQAMVNTKLAAATVSKAVKHAKQFFRLAERKGLIRANPFQDLKAGGERNSARLCFVERAAIQ